jgi:hypothetical protein
MIERSTAPEQARDAAPATEGQNILPVVITVGILVVMAVVIAIDFSSVPGLAVFSLAVLGTLIAAYAIFH